MKKRNNERYNNLEKNFSQNKEEAKKWESLAETKTLEEEERKRWLEAREKWLEAEKRKLDIAKQKAKINWIEKGDENSKFFHAVIKKRERRNNLGG